MSKLDWLIFQQYVYPYEPGGELDYFEYQDQQAHYNLQYHKEEKQRKCTPAPETETERYLTQTEQDKNHE
jgi:hypothetical protein